MSINMDRIQYMRLLIEAVDDDFNPRTREGCDSYLALQVPYKSLFQSAHSCGVR